jgi:hypothetical protein
MSMVSSGANPGVIALWAIETYQAAWERRAKRRRRHCEARADQETGDGWVDR